MSTQTLIRFPARIVVDPNSVDRADSTISVASLREADRVPSVGERVVARQPDDDGSDFVGTAAVVSVNEEAELIYLRVDWGSFQVVPSIADVTKVIAIGEQLVNIRLHERYSVARPSRSGEFNGAGASVPRRSRLSKVNESGTRARVIEVQQ